MSNDELKKYLTYKSQIENNKTIIKEDLNNELSNEVKQLIEQVTTNKNNINQLSNDIKQVINDKINQTFETTNNELLELQNKDLLTKDCIISMKVDDNLINNTEKTRLETVHQHINTYIEQLTMKLNDNINTIQQLNQYVHDNSSNDEIQQLITTNKANQDSSSTNTSSGKTISALSNKLQRNKPY